MSMTVTSCMHSLFACSSLVVQSLIESVLADLSMLSNAANVTSLISSLCYALTFLPPSYYVYYWPAFLSTGLSRTYPLSQYLAAMSHYATSLTPSYSIQTFSHVHFILSCSYL